MSLNLAEAYEEAAKKLGLGTRLGVLEALKHVDGTGAAVLRAPTGYGKSLASVALGLAALEELWTRGVAKVIHTLPMSSIVEDIYARALALLVARDPRSAEELRSRGISEVEKLAAARGMDWVGYQTWSLDTPLKDPLYIRSTLIYTTFDSYVLNLLKVTPVRYARAPFEAARAAIMRSVLILDEAHLLAETGQLSGASIVEALTATIGETRVLKVPILVATATIPDNLAQHLAATAAQEAKVVTVVSQGCRGGGERHVYVEDEVPRAEIETVVARDSDAAAHAENASGKTLIVLNSVRRAIETYRKLAEKHGEESIALLHARLSMGDRRAAVDKAGRARIIVATQVVEAGVDISADTIITDIAPLPSLVQRMGRVARRGGRGNAVILAGDEARKTAELVYGDAEMRATEETLSNYLAGDKVELDWRDPCPTRHGTYAEALNKYGEKIRQPAETQETKLTATYALINRLVTVHRSDAEDALRQLCGFVRPHVAVPVIVDEECLGQGDARRCVAMLSSEYLSRRRNGETIAEKLLVRGGTIEIAIRAMDEISNTRCRKISEDVHICEAPRSTLLDTRGEVSCRKALALDWVIARELGGDDAPRIAVLGIVAKPGTYRRGLGFETDT